MKSLKVDNDFAGKRRCSIKIWKYFQDVFNCMPVAALIENKIFCCHGGLSPMLRSIEQIKRLYRPVDVQETGFASSFVIFFSVFFYYILLVVFLFFFTLHLIIINGFITIKVKETKKKKLQYLSTNNSSNKKDGIFLLLF